MSYDEHIAYFLIVYHWPHIVNYDIVQHIYLFIYWLAMSNSMYNPMIYCWLNKRYGAALDPRPNPFIYRCLIIMMMIVLCRFRAHFYDAWRLILCCRRGEHGRMAGKPTHRKASTVVTRVGIAVDHNMHNGRPTPDGLTGRRRLHSEDVTHARLMFDDDGIHRGRQSSLRRHSAEPRNSNNTRHLLPPCVAAVDRGPVDGTSDTDEGNASSSQALAMTETSGGGGEPLIQSRSTNNNLTSSSIIVEEPSSMSANDGTGGASQGLLPV